MIPIECKMDNYGFLYLDEEYHFKNKIMYDESRNTKSIFFKIDSTDEYVVKYHKEKLNRREVLRMLFHFYNVKNNSLNNIDFPIGYYKENNHIKGLIVYNYQDAVSLRQVIINNNLSCYYNHSLNEQENVLLLLNDILKIIEDLYNNGIIYTDINPGNFIIYKNEVKIIDFDPRYLFYEDDEDCYLKKTMANYRDLVNYVCEKFSVDLSHLNSDLNIKKR